MCVRCFGCISRAALSRSCDEEVCRYLTDIPRLSLTEAFSCKGEMTEGDDYAALKKVGRGKSLGKAGLSMNCA